MAKLYEYADMNLECSNNHILVFLYLVYSFLNKLIAHEPTKRCGYARHCFYLHLSSQQSTIYNSTIYTLGGMGFRYRNNSKLPNPHCLPIITYHEKPIKQD